MDMERAMPTIVLGWSVPAEVFGGLMQELAGVTLYATAFKYFAELAHVQCQSGANPAALEWAPLVETATQPFAFGTPRKVQFNEEYGTELVEFSEWVDAPLLVPPMENDDILEPLIGETLRTNKLVLNVGLLNLEVETVYGNAHRDALGGQLHDLHLRLGNNPAPSRKGIYVVNGKVGGARQQLALDVSSLVKATVSEMRVDILPEAKAESRQ
jgi:hypothetical protein